MYSNYYRLLERNQLMDFCLYYWTDANPRSLPLSLIWPLTQLLFDPKQNCNIVTMTPYFQIKEFWVENLMC